MCEFMFTCPTTGERVQVWTADPTPTWDYFDALECAACKRIHMVNQRTGLIAGSRGPADTSVAKITPTALGIRQTADNEVL